NAADSLRNALSMARRALACLGGPAAKLLGADRSQMFISSAASVEVDLELHDQALRNALGMEPGLERRPP
ncbi:MAG TPA: hypothetical protein VME46_07510, partial [Acidimicrobiales bacterium]|nr:hypothetical protein [Acidimicrobiales bacterium]